MASRVLSINCLCKLTYQPRRFSNFKSQFRCCCKDATTYSTHLIKFMGKIETELSPCILSLHRGLISEKLLQKWILNSICLNNRFRQIS